MDGPRSGAHHRGAALVGGTGTEGRGGCVRADGGRLTLRRTTLEGCTAPTDGGGLYAADATVTLEAVTVRGCTALDGYGGGIGTDRASVVARGVTLEGNVAVDENARADAAGLGGGLFVGTGSLDWHGGAVLGNEARSVDAAGGQGGGMRLYASVSLVDGIRLEDNVAGALGSAISVRDGGIGLGAARIVDNRIDAPETAGPLGGTLACSDGATCVVDHSWFQGNEAAFGGGIASDGPVVVLRSMFCENVAQAGGAIALQQPVTVGGLVAANVFAGNTAGAAGALDVGSGPLSVRNNHLVANGAGEAAAVRASGGVLLTGQLSLVANLVAANVSGSPAVDVGLAASELDWNWFTLNVAGDADVPLPDSNGSGPADLVGPFASCDAADLALAPDSALVDRGDPAELDPDGSPADVGAFGGEHADFAGFVDADGDGWPALGDCDDADPGVHPGAEERCNGKDDDCDELVDAQDAAVDAGWLHPDTDGDGYGVPTDPGWRCPAPGWSDRADDSDDHAPPHTVPRAWCADADGDGVGAGPATEGCAGPPGSGPVDGVCDDADPLVQACPDRDGDGVSRRGGPRPRRRRRAAAAPRRPRSAAAAAEAGRAARCGCSPRSCSADVAAGAPAAHDAVLGPLSARSL
ncbi:MAG: putative metal-binding motif-containing protein [Myxococcota bacterium]